MQLSRGSRWRRAAFIFLAIAALLAATAALLGDGILATVRIGLPKGAPGVAGLNVPQGFRVTVFATDLQQPRLLALGPGGAVLVAERGAGRAVALLGLAFYDAGQFPATYRDSLYVAFHGSWNRGTPVGYKVMRVPLANGQVAGPPADFATGWLREGGSSWGRPVGLAVAADGSLPG